VTDTADALAAGRLVRPYTMTGGRTGRDLPQIALEAQVVSTRAGLENRHLYRFEAARIIDMAQRQLALVELAAHLDVPVGVVRVVTADLARRGAIQIMDPPTGMTTGLDGYQYTTLLRKVLDGIKSL
jgi:hypothetical protein